jgi:DNA-binding beta-propeller fold protein YncE
MTKGTMGMLAALAALAVAAPAQAASGTWERAWGENVDSVAPGISFEICTVISQCQATSPAAGDVGGDMAGPSGVAVDGAGNVYVANTFFNRVDKFDSSGNFTRAWGRDVLEGGGTGFEFCVAGAGTCQAGTIGGTKGEMDRPTGIAVGPNGEVYVADYGNDRIQEFTTDGTFIRMWGKDVVVTGGAEDHGAGFEICQVSPSCKTSATSTGLIGELNAPLGLATDAAGNVYVSDSSSNRIQKFDQEGVPIRTWGRDVISGGSTGFEVCRAGIDTCKGGTTGSAAGEMNLPIGVAVDGSGSVYVADSHNERVQKFSSTGGFQLTWGGFGHLGGQFDLPTGVATDAAGNVYVGEQDNSRVQKFGSDGTFQRLWGEDVDAVAAGTGLEICTVAANCRAGVFLAPLRGGEFGIPQALATDAAGHLYVADEVNNRVEKFGDPPAASATPPAATPPVTPKKKCKKKHKRSASAAKKCKKRKR